MAQDRQRGPDQGYGCPPIAEGSFRVARGYCGYVVVIAAGAWPPDPAGAGWFYSRAAEKMNSRQLGIAFGDSRKFPYQVNSCRSCAAVPRSTSCAHDIGSLAATVQIALKTTPHVCQPSAAQPSTIAPIGKMGCHLKIPGLS
jgi:hypothetical protein